MRWVEVVRPIDLAWDETPIDVDRLPPDGSYIPNRRMSVLYLADDFRAAESSPEDVIGVSLRLANVPQRSRTEGLHAAVVEFCARYGPLGVSERFRGVDGAWVQGEALARWSQESQAVSTVVCLLRVTGLLKGSRKSWWLPLMADPEHELDLRERFITPALAAAREQSADATAEARRAHARRAERRVRRQHEAETQASAARRLRELINEGLERSRARLIVVGERAPLRVEYAAPTLLARIWLRMALAASARTNLGTCKNCGEILLPTGERKRERMRSDRVTCSARCRQQLSRKRRGERKTTAKRRRDGTPAKRT